MFHGQDIELDRAIDVVNLFGSNFVVEHPATIGKIGPNQRVLATIPAGSKFTAN